MKTFTAFIAAAVLSVTTSGVAFADSAADLKVRSAISENVIHGQAQPAALQQATFAGTGKSVAAGRVEQSLSNGSIQGTNSLKLTDAQSIDNDAGKSVPATRVQHALSESV